MQVGIEIETVGTSHAEINKDPSWRKRYGRWGFNVKRDGSLKEPAAEFCTPTLKYPSGLYRLDSLISYINTHPKVIATDRTCGLHVHVSGVRWTSKTLRELEEIAVSYEDSLYLIGKGFDARHRGKKYCAGLRRLKDAGYKYKDGKERRVRDIRMERTKYYVINLVNCRNWASRNTVEFRFFNSTLDPLLVIAFVHLSVGIVKRALRGDMRKVSRKAKRSRGEEKRQAVRLLSNVDISQSAKAILGECAKS